MNWIAYPGTKEFAEYHESEAGRVESMGPLWWDAWVYIPSALRAGNATKHKVGECYRSAAGAKAAVIRQYRKYAPMVQA